MKFVADVDLARNLHEWNQYGESTASYSANVCDALAVNNLTIERIRKFVRKARDYKMDTGNTSKLLI